MTDRVKQILRNSLEEYLWMTKKEKQFAKKMIQDNLEVHNKGKNYIGFGLDMDKVVAGKIFLRIKKYETI